MPNVPAIHPLHQARECALDTSSRSAKVTIKHGVLAGRSGHPRNESEDRFVDPSERVAPLAGRKFQTCRSALVRENDFRRLMIDRRRRLRTTTEAAPRVLGQQSSGKLAAYLRLAHRRPQIPRPPASLNSFRNRWGPLRVRDQFFLKPVAATIFRKSLFYLVSAVGIEPTTL